MGKNENKDPGRVKDEKGWRTYKTAVKSCSPWLNGGTKAPRFEGSLAAAIFRFIAGVDLSLEA